MAAGAAEPVHYSREAEMSSRRGGGACSKPASQAVTRDSGNASLKADLLRVDTEIDGVDRAFSGHRNLPRKILSTASTLG